MKVGVGSAGISGLGSTGGSAGISGLGSTGGSAGISGLGSTGGSALQFIAGGFTGSARFGLLASSSEEITSILVLSTALALTILALAAVGFGFSGLGSSANKCFFAESRTASLARLGSGVEVLGVLCGVLCCGVLAFVEGVFGRDFFGLGSLLRLALLDSFRVSIPRNHIEKVPKTEDQK